MFWHNIKLNDVYENLETNINGLTNEEAKKRILKYGKNELPKKESDSFIKIFFKQMLEPMDILLLIAMFFSFFIKEYIDGYAILFIILVDLIMGAVQEYRAEKTAESLVNLIKVKTKVIRDNNEIEIDSSDIVKGDIVLLESGNKISADLRLIESFNLQIDESILTGESTSVYKNVKECDLDVPLAERKNMAFAGTNVLTGRAKAVVVETGANTEIGQIANKVATTKESKSPLTIRMEKFSKQISILVIFVAIIISIILLIKGTPTSEIFLSVIALSISAMPEGLALALTMALTIASNRMSKKNVIVKKLNSVESLGSCTVIASDKTGTLTINEQTAKKVVLPNNLKYEIEGKKIEDIYFISKLGVLNNESKIIKKDNNIVEKYGDSIDLAFLNLGINQEVDISKCKILNVIPYESENSFSSVFYEEENEVYCTAKGSLEVILGFCKDIKVGNKILSLDKEKIKKQNEELAKEGYRVIAVCEKEIKNEKSYGKDDLKNMHFIGLVAFIDPVRKEVKQSINECKSAGIKVIMITGDHPLTAYSIAKELGISNNYDEVTSGLEVSEEYNKGEISFDSFVQNKKVFTRVTPMDKLKIVESLKRMGEFIAVTGDGVNDAPAIKSANIGIAMGSGTDVAKETASLIILDDNFKSIVSGVKEGRNAYNNIRKISYLLLSCGVAEVLFFMLSIICNMPMPLVAIQLLWLNIVTDGLQDISLSFEREEKNIMKEKPRSPKESIFNLELLKEVLLAGVSMGLIVFFVWIYLIKYLGLDVTISRGYIMMLMVFMQNIHVLNCRSEKQSVFKISLLKNPLILLTISGSILLQIIVSSVPLFSKILKVSNIPIPHIIILFILSLLILIIMESYKKIKKISN